MQTEALIEQLLLNIGEDPNREGLADTPNRYNRFIDEFFNDKPFHVTVFENNTYDEMVIQSGITFYSLCEHHLLPFFGQGVIAYIPDKKIIGLSKLSRILDHFSRRLQTQENLTTQVADFISEKLNPKGVGVTLASRHLCMEMRGVKKPATATTTSCLKGLLKTNSATRNEFLQLTKEGGKH